MKPDIHPKYYPNARVVCACGHTWTTGATQPEIRVDVCSNCHPFYTGEQRIVDTAGRVDRFRMRLAQKREQKVEKKPRKDKFVVIGPEEPITTAEKVADVMISPDAAVAEAEAIVNTKTEEAEPQPTAMAAEPTAVAESEPEVKVRTVIEGSETVVATDEVADDEDRPKRRATPRKPRAPRAASAPSARRAREPKSEAPAAEASPESSAGAAPSDSSPSSASEGGSIEA